tara:strand:+ start:3738 stop:5783 length:2046 start_codon:yes stop_codon:yes gene_type:complete
MDTGRLKGILESEIDSSIGFIESETTDERKRSLEYYQRHDYGNEVEGRSQIVTSEVAEAVDGALPQIMRIFTQTKNFVNYMPRTQEDEEGAQQATDYANWVLEQNQGVILFHNWFKDALLQKVGVVKAFWDTQEDVTEEEYNNLTDDELSMIMRDDTREIVEKESLEQSVDAGNDVSIQVSSHNVKVKRKTESGKIVIQNVPPEEFLISKKATTITDAPFVAHRKLMTRSELIAMGFDEDVVSILPSYDDISFSSEKIARFSNGEHPHEQDSLDDSMQTVEVYECYLKTDFDDDGIAELRRIVYSGSEILYNEPCDYVPFYSVCPYPMPHKFFGQSLADRAMDVQLIKSTVTRQMLDNLYLTNNARVGAVEGQVNLDDLLSVTPGGIVRMKQPNAVVPFNIQPVANQAFPMLEYLDNIQSKRTGVNDMAQGLDPNILQNVTAAAIAASTKASSGKLELISRVFAETGVKELFKGILHLANKYQDKAVTFALRGKYVQLDPRTWSNLYDVSVNVGLGTGDKEEQVANLGFVLNKQEEIIKGYGINNPLVSLRKYAKTLNSFIEALGITNSQEYFNEITPELEMALAQPQEPPIDQTAQVIMQQAQAQIEIDRQKAMADIELKRMKMEEEMKLKREEMLFELQLEREKSEADLARKERELIAEANIKAAKVGAGITSNVEIPS